MKVAMWMVIVALVVAQVGFAGYGIIVHKFAPDLNSLVFSLVRDGFCGPVLLIAALLIEGRALPRLIDIPFFFGLGITGMFGNQLLYLLGLHYTTPDIASVFQPAVPVWCALLAIMTCTEELPPLKKLRGWCKVIGIALATGGAIFMVLEGERGTGPSPRSIVGGTVLLIGNTMCMAVYLLIQKRFVFLASPSSRLARWKDYPVTVTAYSYIMGAICMGFASFYLVAKHEEDEFHITNSEIGAIVYAIFISSALSYGLLTFANKHVPATIVAAFWPVQVPVTMLLSYLVNNEVPQKLQYVGASLIILGLFLVTYANHLQEKDRKSETIYSVYQPLDTTVPPEEDTKTFGNIQYQYD